MGRATEYLFLTSLVVVPVVQGCGRAAQNTSGPGGSAESAGTGQGGRVEAGGGAPGSAGPLAGSSAQGGGSALGSSGASPTATAGAPAGGAGNPEGGRANGGAAAIAGAGPLSGGQGGGATSSAGAAGAGSGQPWIQLFNGVDLTGWTPKFTGSAVGVNYKNTFRVVNGVLVVSYDQYQTWNGEFGHLFYKTKFSRYLLRAEYRFVGKQVTGGVSWGYLNNGFMIHSQSPESMVLDQQFPVSLEVKLFGDDGTAQPQGSEPRTSGKICTPGTDVRINGNLTLNQHCVETSTFHQAPNVWVTIEVEVLGNTHIKHTINGIVTAEYTEPQLDPNDPNQERVYAKTLLDAGAPKLLSEGFIAIQSETQPTEFRKIELQVLAP